MADELLGTPTFYPHGAMHRKKKGKIVKREDKIGTKRSLPIVYNLI